MSIECDTFFKYSLSQILTYHENDRVNITFIRFNSSIFLDEKRERAK